VQVVIAIVVGILYGAAISYLAFVIAGGGHGWIATITSGVGLVLLPLVGLAWARRIPVLAAAMLIIAAVSDFFIAIGTVHEGFEYVERSYSAVPVFVLAWATLWFGWQIFLLFALLRGTFTPRANT
jgi:hypothetical protein